MPAFAPAYLCQRFLIPSPRNVARYYYNYATGVTQWEKPPEIVNAEQVVPRGCLR